MTVEDFHILVEQDVQKISSFAYEDLQPEEVDIQANKAFYLWLDDFAAFQQRGNRLDDTEARLNDIRTLVVRDAQLSLVDNGNVSVASLPENYLYLLGIRLTVYYECSQRRQEQIIAGKKYIAKSAINYNNTQYNKGDLIIGTSNHILGRSELALELSTKIVTGRPVRNEEVDDLNDTHYGVTHYRSPIVSINSAGLYVSTLAKFFVDSSATFTYIRKPAVIDSATPTTEIDLPINGAYKLARLTVEEILKVTEQPQQKIQNLQLTK